MFFFSAAQLYDVSSPASNISVFNQFKTRLNEMAQTLDNTIQQVNFDTAAAIQQVNTDTTATIQQVNFGTTATIQQVNTDTTVTVNTSYNEVDADTVNTLPTGKLPI